MPASLKNVQDIYPLTPLQEGMLFHSVRDEDAGTYHMELRLRIKGDLDLNAFERAWDRVVDRHPIFRTAFVWEGLDRPMQAVRKQVTLPFEIRDWRDLTSKEQRERLDAITEQMRRTGFDPAQAPLLRILVLRTAEATYDVVWAHHHLLTDAWCVPIITNELFQYYYAFADERDLTLPQPAPYREYIAWTQKQDQAEAEAYWRESLQDAPRPRIPLRETGEVEGSVGRVDSIERYVRPNPETLEKLDALTTTYGVTLPSVVQGVWALLLARYAGTEDVLFGTVDSGRPPELEGVEAMVGPFINTLPIRVRVPQNTTIGDWLQSVQSALSEARSYAYCPLYRIKQWAGIPSNQALFNSLFVSQRVQPAVSPDATQGDREANGPSVKVVEGLETQKYPLDLMLKGGEEPYLKLACSAQHYNETEADQLARHLDHVLRQVAHHPNRIVSDVRLMPSAEGRRLSEWQQGPSSERGLASVPDQIAEHAATTPDRVAVVSESGKHVTYEVLLLQAHQITRQLQSEGAKPETRVAIWLDRSIEQVAAFLGILRAGATYLPLDPGYPPARTEALLRDAGAPMIVTRKTMEPSLPSTTATRVYVSGGPSASDPSALLGPRSADASPNEAAYVIYTSGSTGTPKGVVVSHKGLAQVSAAQRALFEVTPKDRVLQFAALGFDASIFEMTMALASGATLVLATGDARVPGAPLADHLSEHTVTLATLTPPTLAYLPEQAADSLDALRCLTVAGDVCSAALVRQWSKGRRFFNLYGPTEASIWSTAHEVTASDRDERAENPPIGRPVPGVETYVLDSLLRPVPVGVIGHLYVGGAGVARGYIARPTQTAAAFLPDPFSGRPGARLYNTGDRARWTTDGSLEFRGRVDRQVQVRGIRIELGEIEAHLEALPDVSQAAVVGDGPSSSSVDGLVGYVVLTPSAFSDSGSAIKSAVSKRLESSHVPGRIAILDKMPLTTNGKVNYDALPKIDAPVRTSVVSPRTAAEEAVARAIADSIGIEQVGREENFFDLGAHSMQIMAAYGTLRKTYGDQLTITDLFERPTVKQLGQYLDTLRTSAESPSTEIPNSEKPVDSAASSRRRLQQERRRRG